MDKRNEDDIQHFCKTFDFNKNPFNGDMREYWIWLAWILTVIPAYLLNHEETKRRHFSVSDHLDMKIHFGDPLSFEELKTKTQYYKIKDDNDAAAKANILIIYSSVSPSIHAQCPKLWKPIESEYSSDRVLRKIMRIIKRENGGTDEELDELQLRIKANIQSFTSKQPTTDAQVDNAFNQLVHLENELHHVGNFKFAEDQYQLAPFETRAFCTNFLNHQNFSFLRQQIHSIPKPNSILEIAKMWRTDAKTTRGYHNLSTSQSTAAVFSAKQSSTESSTTADTDHIDNPIVQAYRVLQPELSNPQQSNSSFLIAKVKFMEAQLQIKDSQLQVHQQHIHTLESQLENRQQQQQRFQQRQRQFPSTFPSSFPPQSLPSPFQQQPQQPFQRQQQQHFHQQQQHRQQPQNPRQQQQPQQQQQQQQQF